MKKFSTYFLSILLGGLAVSSCSKGGDEPTPTPTPEPEPTPEIEYVDFLPTLHAMSRATETAFETGDNIGVFAVLSTGNDNKGIIANYGNYADNVKYIFNNNRFVPASEGIEKPTDGDKVYYHAVYPYTSIAKNSFTFEVNKDQSQYDNHTGSDLCTASTAATDDKLVALKFTHRLSMVVINMVGDNWPTGATSLTVKNVYTKANVDLNSNTFEATGYTSNVICADNGTKSFKVILPPQTFTAGSAFATLNIGGKDYEITIPKAVETHSGKKFNLDITLTEDKEIVEFVGDINPWDTEEKIDEVVPPYIQEKLIDYIPIYEGVNPPNVEGGYFIDPFVTVYCEDQDNGGYDPGDLVNSEFIRFSNQNSATNTLDFESLSSKGNSYQLGEGAFISGTGDNFTAFFNTYGEDIEDNATFKTALVISGTKTTSGIKDLYYAFVMVEKTDPNETLMAEGVFRVFKDEDGLAVNYEWTRAAKAPSWPQNNLPGILDRVK